MMKVLPKPLIFNWGKGNTNKNLEKHNVSDRESEEVFGNKPLLVSLDTKHSTKHEVRYHVLGKTDSRMVLFLSITVRGEKARVISTRPASKKERRRYAKKET